MTKRPLSVTIIGWLFIAAGTVGFAHHVMDFKAGVPFQYDVAWVCFVRLLALLAGVFTLRGQNWARWLLLTWLAYHVVLTAFHTLPQLVFHSLLLVVVAYFLLHRKVSAYFRPKRPIPPAGAMDQSAGR